jgi:hypothetical protein
MWLPLASQAQLPQSECESRPDEPSRTRHSCSARLAVTFATSRKLDVPSLRSAPATVSPPAQPWVTLALSRDACWSAFSSGRSRTKSRARRFTAMFTSGTQHRERLNGGDHADADQGKPSGQDEKHGA